MITFLLASCKTESVTNDQATVNNPADPTPSENTPLNGLIPKTPGSIIIPADNEMSAAKIALGRHLFFDKALSVDGSTACSSCHDPSVGLCDSKGMATSMGFSSRMGTRNTPALANIGYFSAIAWDGKFKTLEDHALAPIFNNIEMGNNFSATGKDPISSGYYHSDPGANDTLFLFGRIDGKKVRVNNTDPNSSKTDRDGKNYYALLQAAWNTDVLSLDIIAKSIACYERTFISTGSKFDRYNNGDKTVLKYNPQAIHGFQLFTDKNGANCIGCHSGYNFTDQEFHNNGLDNTQKPDSGRSGISKNLADAYKFRTPSLRNVAISGPFMHDGRLKSLEAVMTFYRNGGDHNSSNKDEKIKALPNMTDQDASDIIEFLKILTDQNFTTSQEYTNPWTN